MWWRRLQALAGLAGAAPQTVYSFGRWKKPAQKTYLRGAQLPGVRHLMTVTNREPFFKTENELR